MEVSAVLYIRIARIEDAEALATVHAESLAVGVMAHAPRFVLDTFYRRMIRSKHAVVPVAVDEHDQAVGFCCLLDSRAQSAVMRDPRLVAGILIALVRHPRYLRVLRGILRDQSTQRQVPALEIVAFAVSPRSRGNGIGAALITRALEAWQGDRLPVVRTRTHNRSLVAYYEREHGAVVRQRQDLGPYSETMLEFSPHWV